MTDDVISGSFPSHGPTGPAQDDDLTSLSAKFDRLVHSAKSQAQLAEARSALAGTGAHFNGAATPAIEKAIATLPLLTDYSSKWVTARIIRDLAVKSGEKTNAAVDALHTLLSDAADAGTRSMTASLMCDIAVAHGGDVAAQVAEKLSQQLQGEKSKEARADLRHNLTRLAMYVEPCAYQSLAALSADLAQETDMHTKTRIIYMMGDIASAHTANAPQVTRLLQKELEVDDSASSAAVRVLYSNAFSDTRFKPAGELRALTAGLENATRPEAIGGCAQALGDIGLSYPADAIKHLAPILKKHEGDRQRLNAAMALGTIGGKFAAASADAQSAQDETKIVASTAAALLADGLKSEPSPYNRKMIARNLTNCLQNGADRTIVAPALQDALARETDLENKKDFIKALTRMGVFSAHMPSGPSVKNTPNL